MGEKELLVIGEKVFFKNIAVSGPRPLDDPRGHHYDVGFRCIRFLESQTKMLKRLVAANRHQHGGGPYLKRFQVDRLLLNQLELIESCRLPLLAGDPLRDGEKREQSACEQDPADCCDLFGEQVNQRRGQKTQQHQQNPQGKLVPAPAKIQRDLPLPGLPVFEAQDKHGEGIEDKTPDYSEGIGLSEDVGFAPAGYNRSDLQCGDEIDDSITCAVTDVRLAEPARQDSIFRNSVENAVGPDHGGVDGSGEHQEAHEHHKHLKGQAEKIGAFHVHGQPADQVVFELRHSNRIGNDHDAKESDERSEKQTVYEYDQARPFQILYFRKGNLAVDLCQRFLAAHGQHRMTESNQDA